MIQNPSITRYRRLLAVWALVGSLLAMPGFATPKLLMVYYRPWFVARPFSPTWGWHWTMDHFDPEKVDASGQRQIASWYHPLIGPYDSADPAVLEYHVLLMKLAGIDGIVVNWYGPDDYLDYAVNNERARAICRYAAKARLKFALCYEDQSIETQVAAGVLGPASALSRAQHALRYAETNFLNDPAYLRLTNRPVWLSFGPLYFKEAAQWDSIFSVLEPQNRPAFFTEDFRLTNALGAFDWPPMSLSLAGDTRGILSMPALRDYLDRFEERARTWPAYISSAFPRFHDIYQSAGVRNSWGYLADGKGYTFRQTLTCALTDTSTIAMLVTWNDFSEGTMIEPTIEYGYRDLETVQVQRRQHLEPAFVCRSGDLRLAQRLYQLRRRTGANAALTKALDAVFAAIVSADLPAARAKLEQLENEQPGN